MLDEYDQYKKGSVNLKLLNKNMKHLQVFEILKKNQKVDRRVKIAVSHQG